MGKTDLDKLNQLDRIELQLSIADINRKNSFDFICDYLLLIMVGIIAALERSFIIIIIFIIIYIYQIIKHINKKKNTEIEFLNLIDKFFSAEPRRKK